MDPWNARVDFPPSHSKSQSSPTASPLEENQQRRSTACCPLVYDSFIKWLHHLMLECDLRNRLKDLRAYEGAIVRYLDDASTTSGYRGDSHSSPNALDDIAILHILSSATTSSSDYIT